MSVNHRIPGLLGLTLLAALLAACDRTDPPSDRLERAAEDLVAEVESSPTPARQPSGPWAPRNECADMPGGTDFLADLQAAIDTRDADALVALTADDVKLDFGGGAGHQQLRERLAADNGAFWETLAKMDELGCAADASSGITIPWYFAQGVPVDPYTGAIVTGENVPMYNAPARDAELVAELSWEAVERLSDDPESERFDHVSWTDPQSGVEKEGYIAAENLRSIIDYRLIASRRNNRWRITALLAGD
ncbi:hypothetical protein [Aurantiacibacter poecillastricola]|uniref:hypothetical protein n=1 Tax=Aurantiacibacter poecillastricola TaxID=3064385 RepID=UPI00273E7F70|nr:hypothetical protein [Aurantiacibacter sp. 219JJ12-13]MDP5262539.1 hypothetical protein [Aurantiacibacter sp. 219JJ12-13]